VTTTAKIWHPGIENEYVFDTWDEAKCDLERRHGGLASGMLANCVELPVTDLADRLDAAGIECAGREWNHTLASERAQGAAVLQLQPRLELEDRPRFRRIVRLSTNRWAKWYYTNAVGEPSLLCWQRWEPMA